MSNTKKVCLEDSFPSLRDFICLFGVLGTVAAVCAAKELAVCFFATGLSLSLFWIGLIAWCELPSSVKSYLLNLSQSVRFFGVLLLADITLGILSALFSGKIWFVFRIGFVLFALVTFVLWCIDGYQFLKEEEQREREDG